ncbi:90_t:CDS:2 [Gigaspora rosea]|nr:90_t:CDS:2 [Gigaspora rosea]
MGSMLSTKLLYSGLHEHIQNLLDNEAQWARHHSYMNSLPTSQMPSVVESIFLQSTITTNGRNSGITGLIIVILCCLDQLDRPQISIIALIKDIEPSDIIEIWELMCLSSIYKHYVMLLCDGGYLCTCTMIINRVARRWYYDNRQDITLEDLQPQNIEISTTFQQTATNIVVPDFHIIDEIRGTNVHIMKNRQVVNKKVRYANGFGKMKKALNIALDLGCEEELIYIMTRFIDQKKSAIENIDNESIESQKPTVMDPLVVKHRGQPRSRD